MANWSPSTATIFREVESMLQAEQVTSTTFWTKTDFFRWVNMGSERIADLLGCKRTGWKRDIVSGTAKYTLPSEFLSVTGVWVYDSSGNKAPLILLDWAEFQELVVDADPDVDETGTPEYGVIYNDAITLYPTPDYDYTNGLHVRGTRRLDELSSTTNTSEVKPQWTEALMNYTTWRAWLKKQEYERAEVFERLFKENLVQIERSLFKQNASRAHRLKDVEYGPYSRGLTGWKR